MNVHEFLKKRGLNHFTLLKAEFDHEVEPDKLIIVEESHIPLSLLIEQALDEERREICNLMESSSEDWRKIRRPRISRGLAEARLLVAQRINQNPFET